MVRLQQRQQRRRLSQGKHKLSLSSGPPIVRMCLSWRMVLVGLVITYVGGLVVFLISLDMANNNRPVVSSNAVAPDDGTASENYRYPSLPMAARREQQQVSTSSHKSNNVVQIVQGVHKEVKQLQHDFLEWTGWENADTGPRTTTTDLDRVPLVASPGEIQRIQNIEMHLRKKLEKRNLTLCRRLGDDVVLRPETNRTDAGAPPPPPQYSTHLSASCQHSEADKDYYYYNPLDKDRYITEEHLKIPAKGMVKVPTSWEHPASLEACQHSDCLQGARLYPVIPDATGRGIEPIWIKDNTERGNPVPAKGCDIPCQHSGRDMIRTSRSIDKTPFKFVFSMEGEGYYPDLKIDRQAWTKNTFYATTAFNSEIPLPYFSFAEYDLFKNEPIDFDKAIKGAVFLARNCASLNQREKVVEDLQNSDFRLDSLSKCLHNAEPPPGIPVGRGPGDKTPILRSYLFYCSFENQNTPDYISEKMWNAIEAGVVPIYLGAPNIKEHVPEHSLIHVDDFETVQDLAAYLQKVASNRTLYEEYHAWRHKPEAMAHFRFKYNITRTHNQCRTCRWAYAKMYGLGWSHVSQQHFNTQIPRHSCRDGGQGLLTWPVQERWYQRQESDDKTGAAIRNKPRPCPRVHTDPWETHTNVAGHWIRTLHEHDGVIDMRIEPRHDVDVDMLKNGAVLEMVLPFEENDTSLQYRRAKPGHYEWQNQTSRVTMFVKPADSTAMRRQGNTTVQFMHPHAVRIVVEDVDRFHAGAAKVLSYFGRVMKQEFYTPIEVFSLDKNEGLKTDKKVGTIASPGKKT